MFLLASMICSSSVIPAFAAEGTDGKADPVMYQTVTDESEDKSPVTEVKASIKSSYEVMLPKTMSVNNGDNTYNVNVKGDIGGTEQISVVPDATISLSSVNKEAVNGNITQEKQTWNYTDVSKKTEEAVVGTDASGNISINGLTAGHWAGTFNFNISTNKQSLEQYGEDVTLTADNLSTYGIANTGDVVIPEYVTDSEGMKHKIIAIGVKTFLDSSITSIIIPSTVKWVQTNAFHGCQNLKTIMIDKNNQYLYSGDNNDCIIEKATNKLIVGLDNTVIQKNITIISDYSFYNRTKINKIEIPNTIKRIGNSAFNGCNELASVTYNGKNYTNKNELENDLKINNVELGTDAFINTALKTITELTEGQTYSFEGYQWTAAEVDNENHTAVLQSQGVTAGAWPGYTMSKFGNGAEYASNIDGQDISEYDEATKTLYKKIKSVENTKAANGKGLYIVSNEKAGTTTSYTQGKGNYWKGLKNASANCSSFGNTNYLTWLGTINNDSNWHMNGKENMNYQAWYVSDRGNVDWHVTQDKSCIIAPAFNIDLTKVKISGTDIAIK